MFEDWNINWTIVTLIGVAWFVGGMVVRVENRIAELTHLLERYLIEIETDVEDVSSQVESVRFELEAIHNTLDKRHRR